MISIEPKYLPNGSGRDGFIFKDARRHKSESKFPYSSYHNSDNDIGRMIFSMKSPTKHKLSYQSKAVQYHGDGSGRDNYVMYSSLIVETSTAAL